MKKTFWLVLGLVAVTALPAVAAEPRQPKLKPGQYNPEHESVELFAGMESGQIETRLIYKDSTEGRLFIKNKTKQPLNVRLPEAFAGVPVLAQFGVNNPLGGGVGQNSNQTQGGGIGQPGGGGAGAQGQNFFNVPAEQVGQLAVAAVCLEHGKPDPRPAIPYEIRPIESYTSNKSIHEFLKLFGQGKVDQHTAQAAAWHLANNMSWEELAAKQVRRANGARYPYFSPQQLQVAIQMANAARQAAQNPAAPVQPSPGQQAAN